MGDQRFRASPFHTPKLKDLEHAHLSFEHVSLLLKCKFLFHGANVNQQANCWDKLAKGSQRNLPDWRGSAEFADVAIIKGRPE